MFSISVLGCCRLGRIIPFNLAYLRMCMLHYVFFFRIVYGRDRFVFSFRVRSWYSFQSFYISCTTAFLIFFCFSQNRSSIFLTCPTLLFLLFRLLFLADRRRPPYLFNFYHFFCFLLFSCCSVFVFAFHEGKNVTIALLEQHTFTLLLLFDL